jgi:hypothetical protein
MNNELQKRVTVIAKRVREWTQQKADDRNYNPDNLCGWCAISAAELFRQLKREKIDAELHYVSGHCFVVVEDYIVDVTATQFREFEKVNINIIHIKEAEQHWYYQTMKVFTTAAGLREHQLKERWPRKQICHLR